MKRSVPLVAQLEEWIRDVPGWTPIDQLYSLFLLVLTTRGLGGDVLEVGGWCGRSAIVLAHALEFCGEGRVLVVDLFPERADWSQNSDGSYSMVVDTGSQRASGYSQQPVWKEPFEKTWQPIYDRFGSIRAAFDHYVAHAGVAHRISAVKGTTSVLLDRPPAEEFRLAFIDGDHDYDGVCDDIDRIRPRLRKGGWLCFDDAFTVYDGVSRAIEDRIIADPRADVALQLTRKLFAARLA